MNLMHSKKVLVTGSLGALGKVVTEKFLKSGAQVTGTIFPGEKVSQSHSQESVCVDLGSPEEIRREFKNRSFDIWVHCAGGFRYAELEKTTDEDFEFLFRSNLFSTFFLLRELLPKMKEQNFGRIVLISSASTLKPSSGTSVYCASKAGINALTSSITEETKSFDITVNSILPSIIDTPANRRDMQNADFSKWVSPEQIAELIFNLVSPTASSIRGALIPIVGKV